MAAESLGRQVSRPEVVRLATVRRMLAVAGWSAEAVRPG